MLLKRSPPRLMPLIGAALLLAGAAQASEVLSRPSSAARIGMLLPPEEAQAQSLRRGMLLATDQAKVTAVIRGRTGQWGADGVEAAAMVSQDEVMGLIAPPDGAGSHLTLQVAGRTAVPVISLCADSSVTQAGVPWMTRVVPGTIAEACMLFRHATSNAPESERWSAVVPAGRSGREISKDLRAAAAETRSSLQMPVSMADSTPPQRDVPRQLLAGGTSSVLIWLDPVPAAHIVKALRAAGFKGTLAGPGWLDCPSFIAAAGGALEGFVVPAIVRGHESERYFARFAAGYRDRFKDEPDSMALYSYDAANLMIALLRRFGSDALRRGTPPGLELVGASGMLSFDALGNRRVTLQLMAADQDGFVPLRKRKTDQVGAGNPGAVDMPGRSDVTRKQ